MTSTIEPRYPRGRSVTKHRATVILVAAICAWIVACGSGDGSAATGAASRETTSSETLRIASFDFAESELLAELYAQIAESSGIPVTRLGAAGPREILSPALESGAIDLIPEYLGTALQFAGNESPPGDPEAAAALLGERLRERGLVVLDPAPAEDINVFVVLTETSQELGLVSLSDLAGAGFERFGGPVECPDRPLCLVGLAETYGVSFDEFVPQTSLMFTAESLRQGEIDIGLLFSTSPELDDPSLRVLRDDQGLQPPENLVPIIRGAALERWGVGLADDLNSLLQNLTTSELRRMNRNVARGEPIADVVASWLEGNGVERGSA